MEDQNQDTDLKGMTILVVDDEPDVCGGIAEFLVDHGFDAAVAVGGAEAISILEGATYDLVVSDIRMPALDGMALLRKVKHSWPAAQVILMTAYASKETAIEAVRLGAYDYIEKPFDVADLLNAITNCLTSIALKRQNELLLEQLREHQRFLEKRVEEKTNQVLEHELRLARVETLRQLLTTLAHYINNANGAIWSYADFCKETGKEFKPDGQRLVDICLKEGGKVTAVIQSLEEVAEQMDFKMVPYISGSERTMFDIQERIEKKIAELESHKN